MEELLDSAAGGVVDVVVPVVVDRIQIDRPVRPVLSKGKVVVRLAHHPAFNGLRVLVGTQVEVVLAGRTGELSDFNRLRVEARFVQTRRFLDSLEGLDFSGRVMPLAALPLLDAATGDDLFEVVDVCKAVDFHVIVEVVDILVDAVAPGRTTVPAHCPVKERDAGAFGLFGDATAGLGELHAR